MSAQSDLQREALQVLSVLHAGESIEAQMAGDTLVCRIGDEEGVWTISKDASHITEPDQRRTDLQELAGLLACPEDFAPESDPPDDEYEAEFTGRSPYRATTASDDYLIATGWEDDAHSYAAVQRADRYAE